MLDKPETMIPVLVNLSDGKSDGICIFYVKDGGIYPVVLSEQQAELLDIGVTLAFSEQPLRVLVGQPPMAMVENMKEKLVKSNG